jgi:hypothetical protein
VKSPWGHLPLSIACLAISACARSTEAPQLEAIAAALASSHGPGTSNPLQLAVEVKEGPAQVLLRCRVSNASSEPVTIASTAVPCTGWSPLTLAAITIDGRAIRSKAPLAGGIVEEVKYTIPPGEWIERDTDLEWMYDTKTLPRESDIILLWAYRGLGPTRSGVALLPRRSQ